MKINKSYKFRIYPNENQELLIQKTFGCCRYIWNKAIEEYMFGDYGLYFDWYEYSTQWLTPLKKKEEYSFLKEVSSVALQNTLEDLQKAFISIYGTKRDLPRFKSKKNPRRSYRDKCVYQRTKSGYTGSIEFLNSHVKLPKLGKVKCRGYKSIEGRILNATISQDPDSKYYCSATCEIEITNRFPKINESVGIDLGLNHYCITSV